MIERRRGNDKEENWIPAFAGMTEEDVGNDGREHKE